ncbi:MAG: tRNA (adenosine(37)-N6)-threonylcarbamoyltransferase complex dimerization subunit type 1 TsaB [Candidatus Latescibacterota bacterium]
MLILGLDTSTPAGGVALAEDERLLAVRYFDVGLQHSRRLFSDVDEVLRLAGVSARQVAAVAVTAGPGSFTGLRLGMSAAKGFCLATEAALVTVPTLEALAARVPFCRWPVCALLDARKGEVYAGIYGTEAGWPRSLATPRAVAPARLAEERASIPTVYTGDGALAYRELLADLGEVALLAPPHCARPDAGAVAMLGLVRLRRGEVADLASVEPDYLREPDAKVGPGALTGR